MKVMLQSTYAKGSVTGRAGDVIDVGEVEGKQLIDGHYAIAADGEAAKQKAKQTADKKKPETPEAPEGKKE